MEEEDREYLDSDLAEFAEKFDVRAEINIPDGWPQFSVVLRGVPEQVQAALEELGQLFGYYKFVFTTGAKKGTAAGASSAAAAEEEDEEIEVEGMTVQSKERKERRRTDRYGRVR
uniref:Uncharacterized protein n=1 Tax=Strombidinopsis acuminata TaxID=141414 RepID=A0A7S3SQP7_9SPIT